MISVLNIHVYSAPITLPMKINKAPPEYVIKPEDITVEESVNVVWEINGLVPEIIDGF